MIGNLNYGNIVAPNGASIIYGKNYNKEENFCLGEINDDTYKPYTIVITDEDDEESEELVANQIKYTPSSDSSINTAINVQRALDQLELLIRSKTPTFYQEQITVSENKNSNITFNLNNKFIENSTMVYYNGVLINNEENYNLNAETNQIEILFPVEENDYITLIGFISSDITLNPDDNILDLINEGEY